MYGMSRSQYNIAVFGVPLSYYADDPRASAPEVMSDEEWCDHNGLDHVALERATEREEAGL